MRFYQFFSRLFWISFGFLGLFNLSCLWAMEPIFQPYLSPAVGYGYMDFETKEIAKPLYNRGGFLWGGNLGVLAFKTSHSESGLNVGYLVFPNVTLQNGETVLEHNRLLSVALDGTFFDEFEEGFSLSLKPGIAQVNSKYAQNGVEMHQILPYLSVRFAQQYGKIAVALAAYGAISWDSIPDNSSTPHRMPGFYGGALELTFLPLAS